MSQDEHIKRWIADRMRPHRVLGHPQGLRAGPQPEGPGQPEHRPAALRRARADQGRRPRRHRPRRQRLHRHPGHPRAAQQDPGRRRRPLLATPTARSSSPAAPAAACVLALCCTVNPGDEVIVFDPYFVMYPHLVTLAGGTTVLVDTYPGFPHRPGPGPRRPDAAHQGDHRQQPGQPDRHGLLAASCLRDLALLAQERGVLLFSDEVYRVFCYDEPFCSPAEFNEDVLVFDGFSKAYGMTGWRLGFAHGPRRLIEEMIKLQQFTFVCAPSIVQHAGVAAWDYDVSRHRRRLPPQTRPALRGAQGPLRGGQAGRGLLPVPAGAVGHRHRVRGRGDPQQLADHPRQHLQPAATRISASATPPTTAPSTAASRFSTGWPGGRIIHRRHFLRQACGGPAGFSLPRMPMSPARGLMQFGRRKWVD